MDATMVSDAVGTALDKMGSNPYRAAQKAGLPDNAIRYVLEGRQVKLSRLSEICHALGLEFYIGPPRNGQNLNEKANDSEKCPLVHFDKDQMVLAIQIGLRVIDNANKAPTAENTGKICSIIYEMLDDEKESLDEKKITKIENNVVNLMRVA